MIMAFQVSPSGEGILCQYIDFLVLAGPEIVYPALETDAIFPIGEIIPFEVLGDWNRVDPDSDFGYFAAEKGPETSRPMRINDGDVHDLLHLVSIAESTYAIPPDLGFSRCL